VLHFVGIIQTIVFLSSYLERKT